MSARSSVQILVSCGTSGGTTILTFICSFVSVEANDLSTAPWARAPSSLALTDTIFSRCLCHLLVLCSLASFMYKRPPNFNESVHFLSCSQPLQELLLEHPSVLLISDPPVVHHTELRAVCQSFISHHASARSSSSDHHISCSRTNTAPLPLKVKIAFVNERYQLSRARAGCAVLRTSRALLCVRCGDCDVAILFQTAEWITGISE